MVVRRVLPGETGPSGGPAMTDLLGVCTAWGQESLVVQPERGGPVTIALADVVSGKPVPPRPSVRHRASSREAEGHALVLWPTVESVEVGDWVLRTETRPEGRLLKRANSALALDDPGVPLPEAADRVREFYAARDREPMVQVEADSAAHHWFAAAGWRTVEGGASTFLLGSLARALRACGRGTDDRLRLVEDDPRAAADLRVDGRLLAGGRAAYDGDWLGVHSLTVEPELRRQGLATAVVRELLDWGGSRGATTVWLHVELDNDRALAFYAKLGLTPHHDLRYLRAPG